MKVTPQQSYALCILVAIVLDQLNVFSSEHFYEAAHLSFSFTPVPKEFGENIPFPFLGFLLIPVMMQWRKFIKYVGRRFLLKLFDITEGTYQVSNFTV